MNSNTAPASVPDQPGLWPIVVRRLAQLGVFVLLQAVILFAGAGRLDWAGAWVYLGSYVAMIAANAFFVLPRHPDMVAERARVKADSKDWDRRLVNVIVLLGLALLAMAGLNARFGWPPAMPFALQVVGALLLVPGYGLAVWAMAHNRFFSAVVRIQKDRGHTVVSSGPYHYVRHPAYTGGILVNVAAPLLLGSGWAFVPAVFIIALTVARTAREDQTLQAELEGYREYAMRVRYRLLPGLW